MKRHNLRSFAKAARLCKETADKSPTRPTETGRNAKSKRRPHLIVSSTSSERIPTVNSTVSSDIEDSGTLVKFEPTLENVFEPQNWKDILSNIRTMRAGRTAPVDSMGAEKCFDSAASAETIRFQILVSLMLSSQTKDQVTHAAMEKLKSYGLTVNNIIETDLDTISQLIFPVGFYKRKAQYLKSTAKILKDEYHCDIPKTIEDLCKLPGVGPKMAHLCMLIAWNEDTGIGVDTHVHRIINRLNWVEKATKSPEATRVALESWLPKNLWRDINVLLVGFGQQICLPVVPNCNGCLNRFLCPYANKIIR